MIPEYSDQFKNLSDKGKIIKLIEHTQTIIDQENFPDLIQQQNLLIEEAKYWLVHARYQHYDFDKGIEEGLKFLDEMNNETWKGRISNRLATIFWISGDFKSAEKYFIIAKDLLRDHGNKLDYAAVLNNIGVLKEQQGDLNTALMYFENSLELKKETGNKVKEASTMTNIGIIYKHLGDYDTAIKILNLAYDYFSAENFIGGMAICIQEKLQIHLGRDELKIAQELKNKYESITSQSNPSIGYDIVKELNQALVFKHTKTLEAKGKAIVMLRNIYNYENISIESKLLAMKNLLEMKLEEFKIFQNERIINEIEEYLTEMDKIAHKNSMFPLIVDLHILKAKLKQIQGKFREVQDILNTAEDIVKKDELTHLISKLDKERSTFEDNLIQMRELISSNSSLVKRMEINYLEEYLKSINL